jgi:3-oxoacyl-[acyl-carrier-protein] synthase III
MRGAQITGWGFALPDKVVTNADFEARLDTNDEWIIERSRAGALSSAPGDGARRSTF